MYWVSIDQLTVEVLVDRRDSVILESKRRVDNYETIYNLAGCADLCSEFVPRRV